MTPLHLKKFIFSSAIRGKIPDEEEDRQGTELHRKGIVVATELSDPQGSELEESDAPTEYNHDTPELSGITNCKIKTHGECGSTQQNCNRAKENKFRRILVSNVAVSGGF